MTDSAQEIPDRGSLKCYDNFLHIGRGASGVVWRVRHIKTG